MTALPIPALTPDQMSRVDRIMVDDFGVTVLQLMEVAGRAVAAWAREHFLEDNARGKTVLVLAGSGGNGGDGMVAARFLHCWGGHPAVWLSHEAATLRGATSCDRCVLLVYPSTRQWNRAGKSSALSPTRT